MNIDINHLTTEELLELNLKIIERIKVLRVQKNIECAQKFKIGDVVSFIDKDTKKVIGFVISIKKTTVSIITKDYERYSVSPHILIIEQNPSKQFAEFVNKTLYSVTEA